MGQVNARLRQYNSGGLGVGVAKRNVEYAYRRCIL
jgi:hypothetical protein